MTMEWARDVDSGLFLMKEGLACSSCCGQEIEYIPGYCCEPNYWPDGMVPAYLTIRTRDLVTCVMGASFEFDGPNLADFAATASYLRAVKNPTTGVVCGCQYAGTVYLPDFGNSTNRRIICTANLGCTAFATYSSVLSVWYYRRWGGAGSPPNSFYYSVGRKTIEGDDCQKVWNNVMDTCEECIFSGAYTCGTGGTIEWTEGPCYYNDTITYVEGMQVFWRNGTYECIQDHGPSPDAHDPDEEDYWEYVP